MKVVVLTTSYPRGERDVAGLFVRDAVDGVRAQGVDVEVVSPASFRHYGIAYGHGIAGNLRRRPGSCCCCRRSSSTTRGRRDGQRGRRPRARALASVRAGGAEDREAVRRPALGDRRRAGPARAVALPAAAAAGAARDRRLRVPGRVGPGARRREVRVVPSGVEIPASVGEPDEPPHVLFVGRLSPEKGIQEFLAATEGMPRVIVGAGPVDVPEAVGFVPRSELGPYYERAAVVCVPSRREGYGVVAREAMAYGRPVVATAVGGLVDVTGVLVPPGDVARLREVVGELLADAGWRAYLGAQASEAAREQLAPEVAATALVSLYESVRGSRST